LRVKQTVAIAQLFAARFSSTEKIFGVGEVQRGDSFAGVKAAS
jgi:hypothetical protein